MKNCGSCKWWERWPNESDPVGDCVCKGPLVPDSWNLGVRVEMYPNEGTNCPCYTAKGTGAQGE